MVDRVLHAEPQGLEPSSLCVLFGALKPCPDTESLVAGLPEARSQKPVADLPKLLQEPHVPLEEQLNVVYTVLQNRDAVGSHAEGEAGDYPRVVAVVLDELEDVGVDHAAAQDLDPAGGLAGAAGFGAALSASAADEATHHHLGARFGEGEKRRAELRLHAGAEEFFHGVVECALQVTEGDVGVDGEPLDLVEHG